VPDTGARLLADAAPVVAPRLEVRIVFVAREGLEVLERSPILHDGGESHLIAEQTLFGMLREVVEHVLHTAPPAEITDAAKQVERLESRSDEEDDEVAVDFCAPSTLIHLCHRPIRTREMANATTAALWCETAA
jgi:hypothetical protein